MKWTYAFTLLALWLNPLFAADLPDRNIIFIITDDESPTLGCYGDAVAQTPHVDRLAADGTLFRNAFATTASCSASRSVVMSGLHNHQHGQFGHQHHVHKFASFHDVVALSLPRVLAAEGYRTFHIGKYHVAPEEVYHFETYLRGGSGRNAVAMANAAQEAITAPSDKPFFLYFATSDPHRSGGVDKRFAGDLKPNLFGNLPQGAMHEGVEEVFYDPADVPIPHFLPDTPETRSELAHYYQSCSRIDQGVGRLIEILKEAGLYEKTLIVFTADHGMAFAGGKTTVFEGGLQVPFVVRNPYQEKRGITSEALISHVDITPSLLDFAGGLDPAVNGPRRWEDPRKYWKEKPYAARENRGGGHSFRSYHGKSWIPILGQHDTEGWDSIQASHTFHEIQMYYPMRVYRDREFKLIWNLASGLPYPFASDLWAASSWQAQLRKGMDAPYGQKSVGDYIHRPAFELYAIGEDPFEKDNLAENPEYAEVLKRYQDKLKAFQQQTGDPWALKWKYD